MNEVSSDLGRGDKHEDEGGTSVYKTVGWLPVRKIEETARFRAILWVNICLLASCNFKKTL